MWFGPEITVLHFCASYSTKSSNYIYSLSPYIKNVLYVKEIYSFQGMEDSRNTEELVEVDIRKGRKTKPTRY